MEHLALEIFDLDGNGGSKYAHLEENASITITDTSEIFASGDVWTYSFTLSTHANTHIFGTSGEMHGSRLHEQINKRRARLWVEGIPLYMGYLKLDDEVGVTENGDVEVTFESGQKNFEELIDGGKANQVPMMNDVKFGVALWRKRWTSIAFKMSAEAVFSDGSRSTPAVVRRELSEDEKQRNVDDTVIPFYCEGENKPLQEYPRMVFPKGEFQYGFGGKASVTIDCINTDHPYDEEHPYCNIALCYQKQGYEKYRSENDTTSVYNDYSSSPEPIRGYEVMPANRVNSAPNFYVIYWIRSLMKYLGIIIEENQMMNVEDLRRLFFVNTKCEYKTLEFLRTKQDLPKGIKIYQFLPGKRLIGETFGPQKTKNGMAYSIQKQIVNPANSFFSSTSFSVGAPHVKDRHFPHKDKELPVIKQIVIRPTQVVALGQTVRNSIEVANSYLHDAIATSDCFPDVDISEVIKALENAFGIRFLFSNNHRSVRIVLLRNVFRSDEVQNINCDIINETKMENSIRGFRMTYGKSEDTHFYYKGFADMMPHKTELWIDKSDKHDYSNWAVNEKYANIIHKVSAFNNTCYVTPETGNAFGIKVDKDAKRYKDLHPSLFEFAGFMDAEDGDCSGENDTIEEINVGFTPAIMNDINMEAERKGDYTQKFALFVNETMRPRRPDILDGKDYNNSETVYDVDRYLYGDETPEAVKGMKHDGVVRPGEFSITSDMYATKDGLKATFELKETERTFAPGFYGHRISQWPVKDIQAEGHVNEGYRLYLQDNFEPNDDGISPIEKHDWGLTLGIMRGSGSDSYVQYESDIDDEEGNDTWTVEPGSSATVHPDTCDCYGNIWDYNGSVRVRDSQSAIEQLQKIWPNSNINLVYNNGVRRNKDTYISDAKIYPVKDDKGKTRHLLFATLIGGNKKVDRDFGNISLYSMKFRGMTTSEMYAHDAGPYGSGVLIETDSSIERKDTLLELERRAFLEVDSSDDEGMMLDSNGVGATEGRVSLKLRAEKLNPYFNSKQGESASNRRYLQITNRNLRNRGLADQFYKEYSHWVRNARIYKCTVRMELSQLLSVDKTKRITVGDITGFIRKMQFSVSNDEGLGLVTMEIMYI